MPFGELIEQHRVALSLLTLHRERLTSIIVSGVVRQFSKRLILIEVFGETGLAEGFSLIRRGDLTRIDRETDRLRKTLRGSGAIARNHPVTRELNLVEWHDAVASASRIAPSLQMHREGVGDSIELSSRSIQITKHLVIGERPDPAVADEGVIALAIDHLTRLDFA